MHPATPIIGLWPSPITGQLSTEVSLAVAKTPQLPSLYTPLDCDGLTTDRLTSSLAGMYREHITIDSADTTLHTIAIIPLFVPEAAETARNIIEAVEQTGNSISLDIIGLQYNLAHLLGHELPADCREIQKENIRSIEALTASSRFHCSLALVDDYVATGAAIGFTLRRLSEFIASIIASLSENYATVITPGFFPAGSSNLISLGLARLRFDRWEITDYLLNRTVASALEKNGITQTTVDTQGAAERAMNALNGIEGFYNDFYNSEVSPLYERKLSESDIAGQIYPALQRSTRALTDRITEFVNNPALSLPEREATLALLLGRDNPRLKGMLYKQEPLYFDDAYTEPASIFIDSFNRNALYTGLLPTPQNFPELKRYHYDQARMEYVEDEANNHAFNPLPEIKRLKSDILDLTSYIRGKESELEMLRKNLNNEEASRRREEIHHRPGNFEIREQPLDAKYTPAPDLKILPSVDLRRYFSAVRSQGSVGSCSSFATTAMYEYIINRLNSESSNSPEASLSERFLFYHSNVLSGRPEGGSNFYEQLSVMGRLGICTEELCPYSPENISVPPSAAATSEAEGHRVLKACQIPLMTEGSRMECIETNHRLLTSALSEGYPVGFSLKVYPSFPHTPDGHVGRPTESEIAEGEEGYHAMVITGYSEIDKCYIVRNSWGKDFGDKGYCYISSAYVDDPEFNNFACIITQTTEQAPEGQKGGRVPQLTAPFAGTETQIKIAAISNTLDEARVRLESLTKLYETNYRYYRHLIERLCLPNVRDELRCLSEERQQESISNLEARHRKLMNAFPERLKLFRKTYLSRALVWSGASVIALGIFILLVSLEVFTLDTLWTSIVAGAIIFITVMVWLYYRTACRNHRHDLQSEMEEIAAQISLQRRMLLETQLRFHTAGMVIDSLHEANMKLDALYRRLADYNSMLSEWYDEATARSESIDAFNEAMFVSLTNPAALEAFFDNSAPCIVSRIDLTKLFASYASSEEADDPREIIESTVRDSLCEIFKDFNIVDYLTGRIQYPYLAQPTPQETFMSLNRMSNVATRHIANDNSAECRFVLASVTADDTDRWRRFLTPFFPYIPVTTESRNPDILTILTLRKLDLDSVVN